jgi:hypothetical protein
MPTKCRPVGDDPTPDQPREEIAATLGQAMLRLARRRRESGLSVPKESCPQGQNALDLSGDLRLSVPHRTSGYDARKTETDCHED